MSSRSTLIHLVTRAGIGLGALFVVGVLLAAIPNHRPPVVTNAVNAEQEPQSSGGGRRPREHSGHEYASRASQRAGGR